jgi:hypothetical protein
MWHWVDLLDTYVDGQFTGDKGKFGFNVDATGLTAKNIKLILGGK